MSDATYMDICEELSGKLEQSRGKVRELLDALAKQSRLRGEVETRIATLEAALVPFAEAAENDIGAHERDDAFYSVAGRISVPPITIGDLRRAAAALKEGKDRG